MLQLSKLPRAVSTFLGGLLLAAAIWAAYGHSLSAPLVLDDNSSIRNNLSIRQLWPPLAPDIGGMRGRPVTNFSFALNYRFRGTAVEGYHALNIALHMVAALLLLGVIRRTLSLPVFAGRFTDSADLIAFSAALLWALHPLQTEAVTYLSQRTEVLMGLHYLLTIYCFVRGIQSEANARAWAALAVVACFSGMACKEVMVTAPFMVLLYDRTFVAGTFAAAWRLRSSFYLVLASSWLALFWLMHGLGKRGVGFASDVSAWRYALTESCTVVQYLKLALWPSPLVFDYGSHTAKSLAEVWPCALLLVAALGGVLAAIKFRPVLGFLLAWPFIALAPTSSVVPVALQPMAEHRMYLPLAGLVVLAVVAAHRFLAGKTSSLVLLVALLMGTATHRRNSVYLDEITLWKDTVEKSTDNDRAHGNLGAAFLHAGRIADAQFHLERALAINPENYQALNNLGFLYARAGRTPDAISSFEKSLRSNPGFAEARYNLGCVLLDAGHTPEARRQFETALRLNPNHGGAHNNLATILANEKNYREALVHYSQALRLDPHDEEIFANRAYANYQLGRLADAIDDYEQALKINPEFGDARRNLEILRQSAHRPSR